MGLDLWFSQDVARILAATYEAMHASQAASLVNEDYQLGFRDALRSVAVAFGVAAPSSLGTLPPGSGPRAQVFEYTDRWG
jgi:hypothetical protein